MQDPRVGSVLAYQCQYALTTTGADGRKRAIRKTTRFMSSSPEILKELSRRCPGGHEHDRMEGGRITSASAIYPPGLCRAILRGAESQRLLDGLLASSGVRHSDPPMSEYSPFGAAPLRSWLLGLRGRPSGSRSRWGPTLLRVSTLKWTRAPST